MVIHECCTAWDTNIVLYENVHVKMVLDAFPVSPGHALIIPKNHYVSVLQVTGAMWASVRYFASLYSQRIKVTDFNFGVNEGKLAGQTISHVHFHFIPRYEGDVKDPRGGIRGIVMPQKNDLWLNKKD